VREALAGFEAWIVGGAVRDAVLGRPVGDVDVAVRGDPEEAARAVGRVLRGPVFRLSEEFGAWRALAHGNEFTCDVSRLHGGDIEADLRRRDFTVNAMAVAAGGGGLIDPVGGAADAKAGVLRVLGEEAYAADPLRPLRLARLATELELEPEDDTERLTRAAAGRVEAAAPERVFGELRRIVVAGRALAGLDLLTRLGLMAVALPEVEALRGVEQSRYHHLDVYDHTREALARWLEVDADLERFLGSEVAEPLRRELDRPLADGLSRAQALRFAALLHDIGKPATRGTRADGRVTFIGHDSEGEGMVRAVCRRLRTSERLAAFLGGVTRHHLALGFMVHGRPLSRRAVYRYLTACGPVAVEVTAFSCADRLATRGRRAEDAIPAHLELARELLGEALAWRAEGPPAPIRGDDLAREVGIEPGPQLGRVLREIEEASFVGEVRSRADAVEYARRSLQAR
jgi:putative nucleotidyltransferase with HDIG domain